MIFEWKEYKAADGTAAAMKDRFMTHTLRFFKKHGIDIIGVYSDPSDLSKLYYLTRFADDISRQAAWKAFQTDPEWQAIKRETEANGPLLAAQATLVLQPENAG